MDESKAIEELEAEGKKSKAKKLMTANILKDDRFKNLFENPDFQIDREADEFRWFDPLIFLLIVINQSLIFLNRILNPTISRLDKQREKKIKKQLVEQQFEPVQVRVYLNCSCTLTQVA